MNILLNTDCGDSIYLLPLFKDLYNRNGGYAGYYFSRSSAGSTTHFSQKKNLFYDLLKEQPYITSFGFVDIDVLSVKQYNYIPITEMYFDKLDKIYDGKNFFNIEIEDDVDIGTIYQNSGNIINFIPNLHWSQFNKQNYINPLIYLVSKRFGLGMCFTNKWLFLNNHNPLHDKKIAIGRSIRYTENPLFMKTLIDKFDRKNFIFLGLPSEYKIFCELNGYVDYLETNNLLEAAQALNTVDLYIGNQSCLLAIAVGLNLNTICEGYRAIPNCNFSSFRPNFWYGFIDEYHKLFFINHTINLNELSLLNCKFKKQLNQNFIFDIEGNN